MNGAITTPIGHRFRRKRRINAHLSRMHAARGGSPDSGLYHGFFRETFDPRPPGAAPSGDPGIRIFASPWGTVSAGPPRVHLAPRPIFAASLGAYYKSYFGLPQELARGMGMKMGFESW